jgi:hypothetical protein
MSYTFPNSISKAAKLLDEVNPGWADKIDIEKLDFKKSDSCLLGQLYGDYRDGLEELFGDNDDDYEDNGIFEYYTDKSDWLPEINKRRSNRELTFLEALQAMNEGKQVSFTAKNNKFRVLAKVSDEIVDVGENLKGTNNPAVFALFKYTFKVHIPKKSFRQIYVGQRFKYEGKEYMRVGQSSDINAVGADFTTLNLASSAEVELC